MMAAQVRVLRQRVKSVRSTQKITKAQEMIATSRIAKAQAKVQASMPYSEQVTDSVLEAFLIGSDGQTEDGRQGVDEVHLVSTHFVSMMSQVATATRIGPMEVEYVEHEEHDNGPLPAYEFEPSSEELLGNMLPKYAGSRIYAALLDSAASESAARRAACKSATDNANEIIKNLSRQANQARQAQITQELSEIVGGADALAAANAEED